MLALYIFPSRASLLKLKPEKNHKYSLSRYENVDLLENSFVDGALNRPQETAQQINDLLLQEPAVTFILPESSYYTTRIIHPPQTSPQELDLAASKILDIPTQDFVSTFQILDKTGANWTYLHFAIPASIATQFDVFFKHLVIKPSHIIAESMAAFPLFSSLLKPNMSVAFLPNETSLVFYDQLGPVEAVSLSGTDLKTEIQSEISKFSSKGLPVQHLVYMPSLGPLVKGVDNDLISASHILEHNISRIAPHGLDGIDIDLLHPSLVGSYLVSLDTPPSTAPSHTVPKSAPTSITADTVPPTTAPPAATTSSGEPITVRRLSLVEALEQGEDRAAVPPTPTSPASPPPDQPSTSSAPPSKSKFVFPLLLSFIAGVLVTSLGLFVFTQSSLPLSINASVSPTPTSAPPTPTFAPVNRSEIKLQVLNGTTTAKQAGKLAGEMEALGYKNVAVGNSDVDTFTTTTISVRSDALHVSHQIQTDLSTVVKAKIDQSLDSSSPYEAVITIGTDYVTASSSLE